MFRLIFGAPRHSRIKSCALVTFRAVRAVQAKAAQVPSALLQARDDIAQAWAESAQSPKS